MALFNKNNKNKDNTNYLNYNDETLEAFGEAFEDFSTHEKIMLRNVKDTGKHFKYPNGERVTIVTAQITRDTNKGEVMFLAGGENISFELPADMSIEEAKKNGVIEALLNSEKAKSENLMANKVNHLGRLNFDRGVVEASHPSIEKWIDDNLSEPIRRQQEEKSKILQQERDQIELINKNNIKNMSTTSKSQDTIDQENRMRNPEFIDRGNNQYRLNNPKNGNIIEMQVLGNPQFIKNDDGSIDYFYNAFMEEIAHEYSNTHLGNLKPNLQFSLPFKIEDMCRWANDKENPQNSRAVADMMQRLITKTKEFNSLYCGGIKLKNGVFEYSTPMENQATLNKAQKILNQNNQEYDER